MLAKTETIDGGGGVTAPVKYKGIAVLGSHPATVMKAPFEEDWLIYACSPHNFEKRRLPRFDEWFEIHIPIADKTRAYPYLRFLETVPLVWMRDQGAMHLFPGAKLFPEEEYKQPENFGPFHFTSSIAFMMAKAIKDIEAGRAEPQIGLWGIMQASPNEYCMVPETRALTADLRWVPVGDLKVGDELLAFDEYGNGNARRQWRKAVVDATGIKKMPCYRMDMADGTKLISSAAHKWLNADYQWVESRNVRADGDYPYASRILKLVEPWQREETWDAGYLAAAVDGEGHLVQHKNKNYVDSYQFHLGFAQRDNAMLAQVLESSRRMGFEFGHCGRLNYSLRGGKSRILEFLGRVRPPRLLNKFDASIVGEMRARAFVPVENVEEVGAKDVVTLSTSTGTFVSEGFASHNTYQRPGVQFMILEAIRRGIRVLAPKESKLFEPPPEEF